MNSQQSLIIPAVLLLAITIIVGAVLINNSCQSVNDTKPLIQVNASNAIKIVGNNSSAVAYISSNFKVPDWRVVRATMIENATYEINGSIIQEGNNFWKIEMMERSCACSGVKDLYVVEGHVSPYTGELTYLSTKSVSESKYEKTTCASTDCH
ncbi:MAG TPA: hypothetical protein C5S50_10850 [Methanosarcinaceae archaeon]|nr:hypothetical protein [Methanosarcinaceae archaeon]